MIGIDEKLSIKADAKTVFSYLTEFRNRKEFIPMIREVNLLTEATTGVGTRYLEISEIAGRRIETAYEVTEFEPYRTVSVRSISGRYPIETRIELDPDEGRTDLRIRIGVQLNGVPGLAYPIVRGIIRLQAGGILQNLRSILEKPGALA
jgi:carbon monoxide dehydrogenase subunit G